MADLNEMDGVREDVAQGEARVEVGDGSQDVPSDAAGDEVRDEVRDVPMSPMATDAPVDPERPVIRVYVVGPIETNCYVVASRGHALVIDPGAAGAALAEELTGQGFEVDLIVATHGHGDHVGGVKALKDATGAPFWIGEADAERATHAGSPGGLGIAYDDDAPAADRLLHEGDEVRVGDVSLEVIEAPGHTEGGIVLLGDGFAFVGDTIFKGAVGRTDLAGGDAATLAATLERLKGRIPADTVLFCGHDAPTTMADELRSNPYLR